MIKNIIFDLSEVIISGYHGVEKIIEENTNITAEDFLQRKKETREIFLEAMREKISEDTYIRNMLQGTNWQVTIEQLESLIRKNFNIPVVGTMEIIQELKGKYQLILLSDHIKEWMDYILQNNKDLEIFDKKIFSYELGAIKSDDDTFKIVLEKLKIDPNETIFIDDSQKNIDAALIHGVKGILFQDATDLRQQLQASEIWLEKSNANFIEEENSR